LTRRPYRTPPDRLAAAADTRERVLVAAADMLREAQGPKGGFSLEGVAKAAGVTRLTVYNQFGSRRGLLEALFDHRAQEGGLHRLLAAVRDPDPRSALRRLVEIFCDFWSFNGNVIARLHAEAMSDHELAQAVRDRNARRRGALTVLLGRMVDAKHLKASEAADRIDVLMAVTSFAFYAELAAGQPERARVRDQIVKLAINIVESG
jgi:AcrR family transcriptional regulator